MSFLFTIQIDNCNIQLSCCCLGETTRNPRPNISPYSRVQQVTDRVYAMDEPVTARGIE